MVCSPDKEEGHTTLSNAGIPCWYAMLGENDLPDLQTPNTECPRRAKEVIFPHAIKPLTV